MSLGAQVHTTPSGYGRPARGLQESVHDRYLAESIAAMSQRYFVCGPTSLGVEHVYKVLRDTFLEELRRWVFRVVAACEKLLSVVTWKYCRIPYWTLCSR